MVMLIRLLETHPESAGSCSIIRTLRSKIESSQLALRKASGLPILLSHGMGQHTA